MHTKEEKEKFCIQKSNYKWANKQAKNTDKGKNGKRESRRKKLKREREKKTFCDSNIGLLLKR